MVGNMSKDMGVHKGTVVSFVPTLFGYFLGIPSLYVFSFFEMFICDFIISDVIEVYCGSVHVHTIQG